MNEISFTAAANLTAGPELHYTSSGRASPTYDWRATHIGAAPRAAGLTPDHLPRRTVQGSRPSTSRRAYRRATGSW